MGRYLESHDLAKSEETAYLRNWNGLKYERTVSARKCVFVDGDGGNVQHECDIE